jgi:hypothetical protein
MKGTSSSRRRASSLSCFPSPLFFILIRDVDDMAIRFLCLSNCAWPGRATRPWNPSQPALPKTPCADVRKLSAHPVAALHGLTCPALSCPPRLSLPLRCPNLWPPVNGSVAAQRTHTTQHTQAQTNSKDTRHTEQGCIVIACLYPRSLRCFSLSLCPLQPPLCSSQRPLVCHPAPCPLHYGSCNHAQNETTGTSRDTCSLARSCTCVRAVCQVPQQCWQQLLPSPRAILAEPCGR